MSVDRILALVRTDLAVARRDGEQLLLTLGLPILFLVFFSQVDVLPTGDRQPVDFLLPGIIALATLSVAFVRLAIGLGFDRSFGALRRFALTPLGPGEFLAAKLVGTLVLMAVQLAVLVAVGLVLGAEPSIHPAVVGALLLGVVAFGSLAFIIGGRTEGLTTLAIANALYVVLLLLSGFVFELDALPDLLVGLVRLLPSTALAELLRAASTGDAGAGRDWLVLVAWAVAGPIAAARGFRWD